MKNFERNTYTLYYYEGGTKKEILQLIVGRSTVQIWHQIKDSENKDNLPNKGEPFLEYIWSNHISVDQGSEEPKLRVEKFEYGPSDGSHDKLTDFYLKIYWYEKKIKREKVTSKRKVNHEEKEGDNEIDEIENELLLR